MENNNNISLKQYVFNQLKKLNEEFGRDAAISFLDKQKEAPSREEMIRQAEHRYFRRSEAFLPEFQGKLIGQLKSRDIEKDKNAFVKSYLQTNPMPITEGELPSEEWYVKKISANDVPTGPFPSKDAAVNYLAGHYMTWWRMTPVEKDLVIDKMIKKLDRTIPLPDAYNDDQNILRKRIGAALEEVNMDEQGVADGIPYEEGEVADFDTEGKEVDEERNLTFTDKNRANNRLPNSGYNKYFNENDVDETRGLGKGVSKLAGNRGPNSGFKKYFKKSLKENDFNKLITKMIVEEINQSGIGGRAFRYLVLTPSNNGLTISLTDDGIEKTREDDITEQNFSDYFEDVQGNSEYMYFEQSPIGLTEAPVITSGFYYEDDGNITDNNNPDSEVYWYSNYMVKDFTAELKANGEVFFNRAEEGKSGEVESSEETTDVDKASINENSPDRIDNVIETKMRELIEKGGEKYEMAYNIFKPYMLAYKNHTFSEYYLMMSRADKYKITKLLNISPETLAKYPIEVSALNEKFGVKQYIVTVKHDKGIKKITTSGSSEKAAKEKIMKAEGCPEGAIVSIKEKPLNEIMSTIPAGKAPETDDKQILRAAIISEMDATNLYEQMASIAKDEKVKKVLLDIAKEEKTHVGEFQAILLEIDPEYKKEMGKGKEETIE